MKELTERQEVFCNEFIKDLNAVQAAIRAGYSTQHAKKNAYTLLRQPRISERISELKGCLLYTSPSPRDLRASRMPSSA